MAFEWDAMPAKWTLEELTPGRTVEATFFHTTTFLTGVDASSTRFSPYELIEQALEANTGTRLRQGVTVLAVDPTS